MESLSICKRAKISVPKWGTQLRKLSISTWNLLDLLVLGSGEWSPHLIIDPRYRHFRLARYRLSELFNQRPRTWVEWFILLLSITVRQDGNALRWFTRELICHQHGAKKLPDGAVWQSSTTDDLGASKCRVTLTMRANTPEIAVSFWLGNAAHSEVWYTGMTTGIRPCTHAIATEIQPLFLGGHVTQEHAVTSDTINAAGINELGLSVNH